MDFIPTWLMIKQHRVTGLKYFCKTYIANPVTYKGSGSYWKKHLKKHGKFIDTIWFQLFYDRDEMIEYATKFSIDNNIVESNEWANMIIETGIDGRANVSQTADIINRLSDTWEVITPEGETVVIKNMQEYCRIHKLNPSTMSAVARGKRGSHHGYRCIKLTNNRNVEYTAKEYVRETKEEKSQRLSRQAIKGGDHHEAIAVLFKGKEYSTMREASEDTGCTYYQIRKHGVKL